VRFEAEETIWDDDSKVKLSQDPAKILILEKDVRIGSSILVPQPPDSNGVVFTIRANAIANRTGSVPVYPKMTLYLDDVGVRQWEVLGKVPQVGIERDDQDYVVAVPLEKGIHKVEVAMTSEAGNWDLIVDFIDVNATFTEGPNHKSPNIEDFETGDFGRLDWTTYGDEKWFVASGQSHSGDCGARAGTIDDSESSVLEVTLDCTDGEISFYCKVSSELACDYLSFYIDDNRQDAWSGERDWKQVSLPVTAGRRTFRWEYTKDSSSSSGYDTAWIDDIAFPVK